MTLELTLFSPTLRSLSMNQAILEALAYSDIFDYPLRLDELHRYLPAPASLEELSRALSTPDRRMGSRADYYFLAGREKLVGLRLEREAASRPAYRRAIRYGRLLGSLPFIRMVGLTGSLAVRNCDDRADLDYMLVAGHGRVWLARALAVLLGRMIAPSGDTLCPNLIISEEALEWPQPDLYSARELCQMVLVSGPEVYLRLRQVNIWTLAFLPNALDQPADGREPTRNPGRLSRLGELALHNPIGDRLEGWERRRKIRRFSRQAGYGKETLFNEDICQGNFNNHGAWTSSQFQERIARLGLERIA